MLVDLVVLVVVVLVVLVVVLVLLVFLMLMLVLVLVLICLICLFLLISLVLLMSFSLRALFISYICFDICLHKKRPPKAVPIELIVVELQVFMNVSAFSSPVC